MSLIAQQDLHPNCVCLYCAPYKSTRKRFFLNNFINRSFLVNKFVTVFFILKYFSNIGFGHFTIIYLFNVDFFLFCVCAIWNELRYQLFIIFFMFYRMFGKYILKCLSGRIFPYFGNKQVMWKYTLSLTTLPTR